MSDALYPAEVRGLTYTVLKRPLFDTQLQASPGGWEVREPQVRNPVWRWQLIYDYLKDLPADLAPGLTDTDLRTLMGFFLQRRGQHDSFLFTDPDDYQVGPALNPDLTPNLNAVLPRLQDEADNWYSPVQRILGGFAEDVTDLSPTSDLANIAVYAAGALQTTGMTLMPADADHRGLWIAWDDEPAGPVTAEFEFYFRVAFESDEEDFEKFIGCLTPEIWDPAQYQPGIWTLGGQNGRQGGGSLALIRTWDL